MATVNGGVIAKRQESAGKVQQEVKTRSVATIMNEMLDSSGIKNRIKELLGSRAPQFTGSMVSLVNASPQMQQAFAQAPMTIIQSALRAATYDLPIDPGLGYAYVIPFKNKQADGSYRMEANFILGYKGMYQMAMRTGVYAKLNVVDVREGELKSWNPLTEDIEIEFMEDEDERETLPVIGYCGFYRLVTGMEKYIYWSITKIKQHEKKHRKGKYMNPVWSSDFDSMARKTILRELIGRWGMMSIDYRTATPDTLSLATSIAQGTLDDESLPTIEAPSEQLPDGREIDVQTGEILQRKECPAQELFEAPAGK